MLADKIRVMKFFVIFSAGNSEFAENIEKSYHSKIPMATDFTKRENERENIFLLALQSEFSAK